MLIEDVQRLVRLLDEHKRCLQRTGSLERRMVRILLAHPEDAALAESVLDHIERKVSAAFALNSARMLGAREGVELDRLLAAPPPDESDDDDHDTSEGA